MRSVSVSRRSKPAVVAAAPIRVMIVDDSVVVRGHIRHWVESETGLAVVASLRDGQDAIDKISEADPDVVVLDIEMPGIDGVSALPLLLAQRPDVAVIIASSLTRDNAAITIKALSLGALDCIAKPDANVLDSLATFRRELTAKIWELGIARRKKRGEPFERHVVEIAPAIVPIAPSATPASGSFSLRPYSRIAPRILVVGSSTGGPQALTELLGGLTSVSERAPILITQHMPATFTTMLAEHLSRSSGRAVAEAMDGEPVRAGRVYLAPGGCHMRVIRRDGTALIALDDGLPVQHCKPAVDPLFTSAAAAWGTWVLGVVLTGMGRDGRDGAADIVAAGGSVIAQDEKSSVVWGMPAAVAEAGLCSAVLDIGAMASTVTRLFAGERK
jgi:two-component system chemotaxis response regulator CheB